MKKLFISNLPKDASEESVRALFSKFGRVHSIEINTDIFTGKCRGIGFVKMEGHEARAAIAGLNGKMLNKSILNVRFADGQKGRQRSRQVR